MMEAGVVTAQEPSGVAFESFGGCGGGDGLKRDVPVAAAWIAACVQTFGRVARLPEAAVREAARLPLTGAFEDPGIFWLGAAQGSPTGAGSGLQ
jgi:hypothetical protein